MACANTATETKKVSAIKRKLPGIPCLVAVQRKLPGVSWQNVSNRTARAVPLTFLNGLLASCMSKHVGAQSQIPLPTQFHYQLASI